LWLHLDDSAAVAGRLWDEWVAESVRRHIAASLPEDDADARSLLTFLAGIHDIGKISPAFAVQEPALADQMRLVGYPLEHQVLDRAQVRHELAVERR